MKRLCAVSCGKAKKGKADANAGKAPLRHFVPPPPQRGEEFSTFGPFLPFLGVKDISINFLDKRTKDTFLVR